MSRAPSSSSSCEGEFSAADFEYVDYESDSFNSSQQAIDPLLQKDINIASSFGIVISTEQIAGGIRIIIPINIHDLINQNTSLAWGVSLTSPLNLRLRFERPEYIRSDRPPEVVILQNGKICRFGQQVKNFVEMHLKDNWEVNGSGWKPMNRRNRQEEVKEESEQEDRRDQSSSSSSSAAIVGSSSHGWLDQLKRREESNFDPNKRIPFNSDHGFLVHLHRYVRHRVPTACNYCTICDSKHLIGASMLKPSVCERQLCVYAFQQLSVGKDATDTVATGGGVIDLLVAFFRSAVRSQRHDFVLNPYPSVVDQKSGGMIFDPQKKDFARLKQVTDQLPETKEFIGVESANQLSAKLSGRDPACFPLLSWIISSNRSLIIKLQEHQRIARMNTPHQFFFITASEEKQRRFDERKASKGTIFAFHGSRLENWHSILRIGMKNMSGTSGMLNGNVHGNGKPCTYFAYDASVSLDYSQMQHKFGVSRAVPSSQSNNNNNNGQFYQDNYFDGKDENHLVCLAVCEIVADAFTEHQNAWCITTTDEDAVITRFFFVYTNRRDADRAAQVKSRDTAFVEEMRKLISNNSLG